MVTDISGKRFGKWKVIERAGSDSRWNSLWLCVCDCGNKKVIKGYSLKLGETNSCGCLRSDIITFRNTSHGKSKSSEFNIWNKMIQRCTNLNDPSYKDYGGRGIAVCDRWKEFSVFLSDMGERPSPNHTLDRKNNDDIYSPDNCRWATKREQSNNRRNNRFINAFGETKTITDWSRDERCRIRYELLSYRIIKRGWEPEKAITQKSRKSAN